MLRFLIGAAAATYTLATIGPVGWFLLFMVAALAVAALLWWWPLLLVLAIVYGTWRVAKWTEQRERKGYIR